MSVLLLVLLWIWEGKPPLELPTNPPPCSGGNAEDASGPWPKL